MSSNRHEGADVNVGKLRNAKAVKSLRQPGQHDALVRGLNFRALIQHAIGAGREGCGADGHGRPGKKVAALRREQLLTPGAGGGKRLPVHPISGPSQATTEVERGNRHKPQQRSQHPPAKGRLQQRGAKGQAGGFRSGIRPKQIERQQGDVNTYPQPAEPAPRDGLRMNF